MGDVGAEVGLKMRSAIKAKLMELDCYVDDELPDYIMVMVANKRTKSQMKEDLQLFLNLKTSTFVDWLHIVLKKLKEVHVTNPDVFRKPSKRKVDDGTSQTLKKIKKEKKSSKSSKKSKEKPPKEDIKSLTDDLPITANKLIEVRKIVVMQSNINQKNDTINEDTFDIPLLSEVDKLSNETELKQIEKRIKSVKSRLGIQVNSSSGSENEENTKKIVEDSDDDDCITLKTDIDELFPTENDSYTPKSDKSPPVVTEIREEVADKQLDVDKTLKTVSRTRITFENNTEQNTRENPVKKRSVLDRLGKRPQDSSNSSNSGQSGDSLAKRNKIERDAELWSSSRREEMKRRQERDRNTERKESTNGRNRNRSSRNDKNEHEKLKDSLLSRLGVLSKVSVPAKPIKAIVEEPVEEEEEETLVVKEVQSMVKVKPRVLPPSVKQANKMLLLKAVAEAQRSVAQTTIVGTNAKPDAFFTKKYKEKLQNNQKRKISEKDKTKLRIMLNTQTSNNNTEKRRENVENNHESTTPPRDNNKQLEYVPKPIKKSQSPQKNIEYKPSPVTLTVNNTNSAKTTAVDSPVINPFKHQFIVTLDGVDSNFGKFNNSEEWKNSEEEWKNNEEEWKNNEEEEEEEEEEENRHKKTPSPIVFEKKQSGGEKLLKTSNIPDKLPTVSLASMSIKSHRERCKFWPGCKLGDQCEFLHPVGNCKVFPNCKFGDKCLYLHPSCKFESSCTRRDCPYSHSSIKPQGSRNLILHAPTLPPPKTLSVCKFHPNCSNTHCTFYHPRPCKFGKYCKNVGECSFTHSFPTKPNNLTWRST